MSENPDTPEGRLEQFAAALEANDISMFPPAYMSDSSEAFVADVREVLAKLAAH